MKKDLLVFGILILVSLCLGAGINQFRNNPLSYRYATKQERMAVSVTKIAAAAAPEASLSKLDLPEFRKIVETKSAIILDARRNVHWRRGHIPGALGLSQDAFENDYASLKKLLEANKDRQIIVYCWGEMCEDSRLVAHALVKLGYRNVSIFTGGWMDWTQNGLPVEGGKEAIDGE